MIKTGGKIDWPTNKAGGTKAEKIGMEYRVYRPIAG